MYFVIYNTSACTCLDFTRLFLYLTKIVHVEEHKGHLGGKV